MYREREALFVPEAVVWTRRVEADADVAARVLPDGCMDLIWTGSGLLVAGPDTSAQLVAGRAGDAYLGLRFAPGTAAAVLGVPAWELRDRRLPLGEVWPGRRARVSEERVAAAVDRGAELEALVAARVRAGAGDRDRVREGVLRGARRGLTVGELARELALSERQLRRRCLDVFGYGPKMLERVLRLGRALGTARAGVPFAQVAVGAGYADQAHLAREVRALAGVPLRRLLADGDGEAGVGASAG